MRAGVTMRDPSTAYLDWTVELGEDVILEPNVILRGTTTVGAGSVIGAGSQLIDATIGAGVRVWASIVESSTVEDEATIGPFSHLRPGTVVGRGAEVGNYAELKNTQLGAGSRQHHMSYLGDAEIGDGRQHRRGRHHRQLRRDAQAPDDDRRRSVHRRRHHAHRPGRGGRGRADRRRRGRHPRRPGGQAGGRRPGPHPRAASATGRDDGRSRARGDAGARPPIRARGRPRRAARLDGLPPPDPCHRHPDLLRGPLRGLRDRPRDDAPDADRPARRRGRSGSGAGQEARRPAGPVPRGHPDRPDLPRLPGVGLRRGQPDGEPREGRSKPLHRERRGGAPR